GFLWRDYDLGVDWRRVLHGETSLVLHAPLPVRGEVVGRTTFGPIFDKGADKGAVVYHTRTVHDAAGGHMPARGTATLLRGEGGFGGSPEGQPRPHPVPERAPDHVVRFQTAPNQALLYRLSGDFNPLHADPAVARSVGFEKPILHGLAS